MRLGRLGYFSLWKMIGTPLIGTEANPNERVRPLQWDRPATIYLHYLQEYKDASGTTNKSG